MIKLVKVTSTNEIDSEQELLDVIERGLRAKANETGKQAKTTKASNKNTYYNVKYNTRNRINDADRTELEQQTRPSSNRTVFTNLHFLEATRQQLIYAELLGRKLGSVGLTFNENLDRLIAPMEHLLVCAIENEARRANCYEEVRDYIDSLGLILLNIKISTESIIERLPFVDWNAGFNLS